jgi:hypothetical protein
MKHDLVQCAAIRMSEGSPPMFVMHQCTRCGITLLTTMQPYSETFFQNGQHFEAHERDRAEACAETVTA